jgi:hypothetical protein
MRMSIRVGVVRVDLNGVDMNPRQVRSMLGFVAGIAAAMESPAEEPNPIGFGLGATMDRAPEITPTGYWEDEE